MKNLNSLRLFLLYSINIETMMRLFVSGLILTMGVGQLTGSGTSSQCCDPREASCQKLVNDCMASSFSSDSARCNSICDPSRTDCQSMINQCMDSSTATSTSRCQSLACSLPGTDSTFKPSPMFSPDSTFKPSPPPSGPITDSSPASTPRPSIPAFTAIPSFGGDGNVPTSTCCDGTTEMCKMSIGMCLATTGNPSMCERMACPSPGASPYPTPRQCCDGSMLGCQMTYRGCMNETGNADMCEMIICRDENSSPLPTKKPNTECCDGSLPICQMAVRECLAAGQPESMCQLIMCPVAPPTPASSRPPTRPPMPTQRPTPSAFPTMFIKPLMSTMPSRLPRRTAAPTSFVIPERMPAELKFPRANLTIFKRPEKIQEIQAKLACALRLPLEKIEIWNISILRATGKLEALDIDVSVARLSSNGSARCMVFKDDPIVPQVTSAAVARRNLQGSSGDTIVVNYDIVSPTEEIATSPSSELNAAITGDASMMAFANSVGSAGMTAEVSSISAPAGSGVAPAGASNGPTSAGTGTTQASSTISAIGVGVGVAVGAVAIVGVGIAVRMYRNRKRRQARQVIHPVGGTVWRQSVVQANPAHGSVRAMYAPGQVRSGV